MGRKGAHDSRSILPGPCPDRRGRWGPGASLGESDRREVEKADAQPILGRESSMKRGIEEPSLEVLTLLGGERVGLLIRRRRVDPPIHTWGDGRNFMVKRSITRRREQNRNEYYGRVMRKSTHEGQLGEKKRVGGAHLK